MLTYVHPHMLTYAGWRMLTYFGGVCPVSFFFSLFCFDVMKIFLYHSSYHRCHLLHYFCGASQRHSAESGGIGTTCTSTLGRHAKRKSSYTTKGKFITKFRKPDSACFCVCACERAGASSHIKKCANKDSDTPIRMSKLMS
jgi:hypothetical protein